MKNEESIPAVKDNNLIFDVGMHRGEDTDFYLQKGFSCVAFEADPENASFCRQRFRSFIDRGQLIIVEGAIVDASRLLENQKTVKFYKNANLSVLGTIRSEWAEQNKRLGSSSITIEVNIVNFEDAIRIYGMPHYMKIDIEGSDMICLNALKKFKERPDYVSFEADRSAFANNKNEISLLVELGYNSFQAVEQSEDSFSQSPPLPAKEGKYVAYHFEKNSSGLFGAELGDQWKSKQEILRLCRMIRLGHYLVSNDGIMMKWKFKGSRRLQSWAKRFVRFFTNTAVPGWHDIHARYVDESK
jgi:FkbM family methyltransferase